MKENIVLDELREFHRIKKEFDRFRKINGKSDGSLIVSIDEIQDNLKKCSPVCSNDEFSSKFL